MGCDIHFYIEYDTGCEAPFEDSATIELEISGDLDIARHYDLFAALAGVRRNNVKPLIQPRGFPKIVSQKLFKEYFSYVLDVGENQRNDYDELREHADQYVEKGYSEYRDDPDKKNGWVSCPDWHTPSWLYLSEINDSFKKQNVDLNEMPSEFIQALKILEGLESTFGKNKARSVFWFDN